jgi:hypothetical protein
LAAIDCRADISEEACDRPSRIAAQLSRNPWLLLLMPFTGKFTLMPETLIFDVIDPDTTVSVIYLLQDLIDGV